jgi:hypothetical protein
MRALVSLLVAGIVAGCSDTDTTSQQRASWGAIGGIAACGLAGGPIGALVCVPIGIAASYAVPKNAQKPNSNGVAGSTS